jgi:hypothetical protein
MARRRPSLIAAAAAAALIAAGCGGGGAGGAGSGSAAAASHPNGSTQAGPPTSLTVTSVTDVQPDARSETKRYLAGLAPVRQEARLADRAADHEASIAPSGDYAALAADSRTVAAHLGRAAAAARRMQVPQGLERAHADLVSALAVGRQMALRLAALYEHIGPDASRQYRRHVLPLEKRSLRLANRWYVFLQVDMAAGNVREPGWVGHLFDWT